MIDHTKYLQNQLGYRYNIYIYIKYKPNNNVY